MVLLGRSSLSDSPLHFPSYLNVIPGSTLKWPPDNFLRGYILEYIFLLMNTDQSFWSSLYVWYVRAGRLLKIIKTGLVNAWHMCHMLFFSTQDHYSPLRTNESSHRSPLGSGSMRGSGSGFIPQLLAQGSLHSPKASTHMTCFLWVTESLTDSQHEIGWKPLGGHHWPQALESEC